VLKALARLLGEELDKGKKGEKTRIRTIVQKSRLVFGVCDPSSE